MPLAGNWSKTGVDPIFDHSWKIPYPGVAQLVARLLWENTPRPPHNFISGCSAVGSAPALGAGCRRFESCHSDHLSWKNRLFRRFFCVLSSIFAVLAIAVLRWFQGQKSSGSTSKDSRRNRQIPNPSLTAKESDDLPGGIGLTVIRPSQDIRRLPGRQRMLSSD